MMYEEYELKVKRLAKIKNTIKRFRVLILSILATAIILITAFLSTKGMIIEEISIPSQLEYGEEYSYSSKALFSDVEYEFSQDNITWIKERPIYAGAYYIRSVSNSAFGKKYGSPIEFVILPKPITLSMTDSITYGSKPTITAQLNPGDKIESYDIFLDNSSSSTTTARIKNLVIVNSNKENVADSYKIASTSFNISVTPRSIAVIPMNKTKIYDGKEITYNSSDLSLASGALATDDTIRAEIQIQDENENVVEAINVGSYQVKIIDDSISILHGGSNYNHQYSISQATATISITKRRLAIQTASIEKEYDGIAISSSSTKQMYSIVSTLENEGLVEGHRIEIVENTETRRIDVGASENRFEIRVLDEEGNDVTSNYSIEYVYGSLAIQPRSIQITTSGSSKVYDGLALASYEYTITLGQLIGLHQITIISSSSQINVGSSNNEINLRIRNTSTGVDVTSQYQIEFIYGILEVLPMTIHVSSNSVDKIYDGLYAQISYQIQEDLPARFTSSLSTYIRIKDTCSLENEIQIQLYESNVDATNNFEIIYSFGTLVIQPRRIEVALENQTYIYDSEIIYSQNSFSCPEIVGNDQLIISEVSYYQNGLEATPKNVGAYEIRALSYGFTDLIAQGNYEIAIVYPSMLYIQPREISIMIHSQQVMYGQVEGFTIDPLDYIVTSSYIAQGDVIYLDEIAYSRELENVGLYSTYIRSVSYKDAEDEFNYSISFDIGALEITPREIIVQAKSYEFVYKNDFLFPQNGFEVVGEFDILSTDEAYINAVSYYQNEIYTQLDSVGVYEARIQLGFMDLVDNNNYSIEYIPGAVVILKRAITISTQDIVKEYDGLRAEVSYEISKGSLANGHTIEIAAQCDEINAGEYVSFIDIEILEGGSIVTENYEITYTNATITITPKTISISPVNQARVYGEALAYPAYAYIAPGLLLEDTLTVTGVEYLVNQTLVSPRAVGQYDIHITSIQFDSIEDNNNYILILDQMAALTITKRAITVLLSNQSIVYGSFEGFVFESDAYSLSSSSLAYEDQLYITGVEYLQNNQLVQPRNAGVYVARVSEYEFSPEVQENYTVQFIDGALTITPKDIYVTGNNIDAVYADDIPYDLENSYTIEFDGLAYEDRLEAIQIEYYLGSAIATPKNVGEYDIYIFFVEDENYYLHYTPGVLRITPLCIHIRPIDQISVYGDSYAYPYNGYTSDIPLALGDELEVAEVIFMQNNEPAVMKNAGEYAVYISKIYFPQKEDNSNYTVIFDEYPSTLLVTPREVTIAPAIQSFVYGEEIVLSSSNFICTSERGVLPQDALYFTIYEQYIDPTIFEFNAGNYDITLVRAGFTDEIIQENYKITLTSAKHLEIIKRTIAIRPISYELEYGEFENALIPSEYDVLLSNVTYSLLPGDELIIQAVEYYQNSQIVTPRNAGIYAVKVSEYTFMDDKDNSNYTVVQDQGYLTITPRLLHIYLMNQLYTYSEDIIYPPKDYGCVGLVYDDAFRVFVSYQQNSEPVEAKNVGDYRIVLDYVIFDEETDIQNYKIEYDASLLTIAPLELPQINELFDLSATYADQSTLDTIMNQLSSYVKITLPYSDSIRVLEYKSYLDSTESAIQHVGEYLIYATRLIIVDENGVDISSNYKIEDPVFIHIGVIRILKRSVGISVIPPSNREYDGTAEDYPTAFEATTNSFVFDQENSISIEYETYFNGKLFTGEMIDAGTYSFIITSYTTSDEWIEWDYSIYFENAYDFIIMPRALQIQLNKPQDIEYNAMVYDPYQGLNKFEIIAGQTIAFEELSIRVEFLYSSSSSGPFESCEEIKNAGVYKVIYLDAGITGGRNRIANYAIQEVLDTSFEITKINLEIKTNSLLAVYSGEEISSQDFEITSNKGLLEGHSFDLEQSIFTKQKNVGSYENKMELAIIDENLELVSMNYSIVYINGVIEIAERELTITTASAIKEYSGSLYPLEALEAEKAEGLVEGHTLKSINSTAIIHVGRIENIVEYTIYDENGYIVNSNYSINYIYGTLEITPADIYISVVGYNGQYTSYNLDIATECMQVDGLKPADSIEYSYLITNELSQEVPSICNVGVYFIQLNGVSIFYNEQALLEDYIIHIEEDKAEAEITKKQITLQTRDMLFQFDNQRHYDTIVDCSISLGNDGIILADEQQPYIQYPGWVENALKLDIKSSISNQSVMDNYEITYIYGTLRIEDRIYIEEEFVKTYDGATTILNQDTACVYGEDNEMMIYVYATVYFDEVTIYDPIQIKTNITSYRIEFNGLDMTQEEMDYVRGLYTILSASYTIEVNHRSMYIKPINISKIYDGLPLVYDPTQFEYASGMENQKLVVGQAIQVQTSFEEAYGTTTNEYLNYKKNVITSAVIYDSFGNDVTYCYSINDNFDASYLTNREFFAEALIQRRVVYVSTGSAQKVYDGTALYNYEYSIDLEENLAVDQGLIEGQAIELSDTQSTLINASERVNRLRFVILDNGVDVSKNYSINYDYAGMLVITPAKLTITTNTDFKYYDGTALSGSGISVEGLDAFGYTIDEAQLVFAEITEVGFVMNTIDEKSIKIYNESGSTIRLLNFDVTYIYGTLTILPLNG